MLELYHWEPSVGSGELLIGLTEKGLEFERHYVDLLQWEQHRPELLRLSPTGELPVLIHGGRAIVGTGPALLYLDDAFPQQPLAPRSLARRYEAHAWLRYSEERIAPYLAVLGWHDLTRPTLSAAALDDARRTLGALPVERRKLWEKALDDAYTDEEIALAREVLGIAAARLEHALKHSPWLCGESYSIADVGLVLAARALQAVLPDSLDARHAPHTLEWLARIEARPAVRATLALARGPQSQRLFTPGREPARWG